MDTAIDNLDHSIRQLNEVAELYKEVHPDVYAGFAAGLIVLTDVRNLYSNMRDSI